MNYLIANIKLTSLLVLSISFLFFFTFLFVLVAISFYRDCGQTTL